MLKMSFLNTSFLCRGPLKNIFRYAHVVADGRGRCNEFFNSKYKMDLGNFDPEIVVAKLSDYKFPQFCIKYSPEDCVEHAAGIHGRDEDQNEIFFLENQFYEIGGRTLGNNNNVYATEPIIEPPRKEPDQIFEYKTLPMTSSLFNPTIDDKEKSIFDRNHWRQYHDVFAAKPNCHGLYYLGVVMQQIIGFFAGGDVQRLKKLKTRFSSLVTPDSTLLTKSLKIEDRIHFETFEKATGKCVLKASYLDLRPD